MQKKEKFNTVFKKSFAQKKSMQVKKKLKNLSLIKNKFFETTSSEIHYHSNKECIFSHRFLTLLKKTLGKPSQFFQKTKKEQNLHAQKIFDLLLVENDWKAIISKSKYEDLWIKKLFPKETTKFKLEFKKLFFPPKNETHQQKIGKYGSEKCRKFLENLLTFLKIKKVPFLKDFPWKLLEDQEKIRELSTQVVRNLNSEYFFNDMVKICMKKAYDHRINVESNVKLYTKTMLTNPFLYVKRTHVMYPLQECIVIHLSIALFSQLNKAIDKFKYPGEKELVSFLSSFFKEQLSELMSATENNDWYRDTFNVSLIMFDIFSVSGLVIKKDIVPDQKTNTTNVVYWLKHDLENTIPFSNHLPRIIPPSVIHSNADFINLISTYQKGKFSVSPSKQSFESLNISQKKIFRINKLYLKILNNIHNEENEILQITKNTPFPTKIALRNNFDLYQKWCETISVSSLQKHIHKKVMAHLGILDKNKDGIPLLETKTRYLKTLSIADVTSIERELNYGKKKTWVEYNTQKAKRQLLQTSIVIAELYQDFPLYYGTKLDYRTRMYAWEYLLSRTTGELKQLLCDFKPLKITKQGLKCLLTAYYRFSLEGSIQWNKFLLKNKKFILFSQMNEFFNSFNYENRITEFIPEKKICYLLLLHHVIKNVFDKNNPNKKVDTFIEIDQVCSGVMFLSLLLGVEPLAKETNVLGGYPHDIYKSIMNHIPNYFLTATYTEGKEKLSFDQHRVLNYLSTQRNCTKGMLMKWAYTQGNKSRMDALLTEFRDYYSSEATVSEFNTIMAFSKQYDEFLESLFPKIKQQRDIIIKVLDIRLEADNGLKGINIRTLDGCIISWNITPMGNVNKGYWNPVTHSPLSFKIKIPSNSKNALIKMKKDYYRGLFPNIIHSIDAAIMRLIIFKVWQKTSYIVNQLHDCILCHPNIVPVVYEVIEEIYTGGTFDNLASKVFFTPMQEGLNDEDCRRIKDLEKTFYQNMDKFKIKKEVFVAQNAYVYDGSVNNMDLFLHLKEQNSEKVI